MRKHFREKLLQKVRSDYNAIAEEFASSRFSVPEDIERLTENVKGCILDAGCGNGRLFSAFKSGVDYHGIDSSERLLAIARKDHPGVDFKFGDVLNIPFGDNLFDAVFCLAVLHHVPSFDLQKDAMKEMKRVLKRNGKLILRVWDLRSQRKKIFASLFKKGFDFRDLLIPWKNSKGEKIVDRYVHAFSPKELEKLATKAGFIVEKSWIEKGNICLILTVPMA